MEFGSCENLVQVCLKLFHGESDSAIFTFKKMMRCVLVHLFFSEQRHKKSHLYMKKNVSCICFFINNLMICNFCFRLFCGKTYRVVLQLNAILFLKQEVMLLVEQFYSNSIWSEFMLFWMSRLTGVYITRQNILRYRSLSW